MSKSRGNFLDPTDFVAAFGSDGARYVALREVPFDKDAEVSWDGFVRRYNADLANDFGNLVNRTVAMTNRYLGGERPAPRPAAEADAIWSWTSRVPMLRANIDDCLLHEALGTIWAFVGEANRFVDAEKPWELSKAATGGDTAAGERLRLVLGDLVEACRLIALAAAPFLPKTAPRVLGQLGYAYSYEPDGNGGPSLIDELQWGAHAAETGTLTAAQPLFPRLETETAAD